MKITMVGTGYVGLVTGTCLANLGHNVICLDVDEEKIRSLENGKVPIYEPGLNELIKRNVKEGRLSFTTDSEMAIKRSDIIFIAVGTPSDEKGEADLKYVKAVAETIGEHMNGYKVVVDKSTVPVETGDMVKKIIKERTEHEFDVVSNPEFLKEGAAVKDFQNPDRIIIGAESEKAKEIMGEIYKDVARINRPIIFTDVKSAELIKYASNAMLATRISFMNQLSHLCDKTGADIKEVAKGMGFDDRIGPRFLQAGVGYGGSCFPKDTLALIHSLKKHGLDSELFQAVHDINKKQRFVVIKKLEELLDIKGKTIAVWGIAFKPRTDDIREAPSLDVIKKLQEKGASIKVFDPVAMENAKKILRDIEYHDTPFGALKDAHALIIMTEWDEFRSPDFDEIKKLMAEPIIIDGRNIYSPKKMKDKGFQYRGIGRAS